MGTTIKSEGTTTSTATPTAAESEMQKAQVAQYKAYEPGQTAMFNNAFTLGNKLLTSFGDSEQWNSLIGGITDKQTRSMVNQQDKSLRATGQSSGILDSGTMASGRLRAASDLSNTNAQFNVGAMQNALNLALSGQAQVQAPAGQATGQLNSQLQGLRTVTGTTSSSQRMPYQGTSLGVLGTWGGSYCWVAAEIFNGWNEPKTNRVRYYIGNLAPTWFRKFYLNNGEKIAKFIHNKPVFKALLRPLFELFAYETKRQMSKVRILLSL